MVDTSSIKEAQEQVVTLVDNVIDRIVEIADQYGASAVSLAREFRQQYSNRSQEEFGV